MSIRFKYFSELNCLSIVGEGRVSLEAFLEYYRTVKTDNTRPTLRILSDYRQLDPVDLKLSDIEEMKKRAMNKVAAKYENVREAAVVSDYLTWGLSRQYDGVYHSETYEFNVFTDIKEAKIWLGLDAEAELDLAP